MDLAEFLVQLFRAHGIDVGITDDWVVLPRPYMRVQATVVNEVPHPDSVVVQVDVRIFVGFGRLMLASFAGVGAARADAVRDAMNSFVASSFHVILATFFGVGESQVEREQWVIAGSPRTVTTGGVLMKGPGQQPASVELTWSEQFRQALQGAFISQGTHWIQLYVALADSKPQECQVLLDNEPWETIQTVARSFSWPKSAGFLSVRLFLMIQGGLEVSAVAAQIYQSRDLDDTAIVAEVIRQGIPASQAELTVALLPLAFGRVLLNRLPVRFSDEITFIPVSGGLRRSIKLDDFPLFRQAYDFAKHAYTHGAITQDEFRVLAFRSAEVHAVNNALNAGSRPENLVLIPPVLPLSYELGDTKSVALPNPEAPKVAAIKPKKGWRFWR